MHTWEQEWPKNHLISFFFLSSPRMITYRIKACVPEFNPAIVIGFVSATGVVFFFLVAEQTVLLCIHFWNIREPQMYKVKLHITNNVDCTILGNNVEYIIFSTFNLENVYTHIIYPVSKRISCSRIQVWWSRCGPGDSLTLVLWPTCLIFVAFDPHEVLGRWRVVSLSPRWCNSCVKFCITYFYLNQHTLTWILFYCISWSWICPGLPQIRILK